MQPLSRSANCFVRLKRSQSLTFAYIKLVGGLADKRCNRISNSTRHFITRILLLVIKKKTTQKKLKDATLKIYFDWECFQSNYFLILRIRSIYISSDTVKYSFQVIQCFQKTVEMLRRCNVEGHAQQMPRIDEDENKQIKQTQC